MRAVGWQRAAVVAVLPVGLALLAWVVASQHAVPPARVVAGLLLAFVLPGDAATATLFPGRTLSSVERIVLTPALSLAAVVLGGLLANVAGLRLTAGTWGGITVCATTILAGVGYVRWWRRASRQRPDPAGQASADDDSGDSAPETTTPDKRWAIRTATGGRLVWTVAPILLVVALLGVASWIAVGSASSQSQVTFTALSVLPDDDPNPLDPTRPVTLAVDSHEAQTTQYVLTVRGETADLGQYPLLLVPGQVWKLSIRVPRTERITADLFKDSDTTPYRSVFLSAKP
jgi:uncharacterized membrane protein